MPDEAKRSYRSPLREAQSRKTRHSIVEAAAQLFIDQGYGATTTDAIATAAGVSRKTFFIAVGSKAEALKLALLWAVLGDDETLPFLERPHVQAALREQDARKVIVRFAHNVRRISSRTARLHVVMQATSGSDPEISTLYEARRAQRQDLGRILAQAIADRGALKTNLTVSEANDVIWLFNDPALYHRLVLEQGWSEDRHEQWLADSLIAQLIRDDYEPEQGTR